MRFLQFAKSAQGTNITHLRHTFIRTLCLSLVFLSLSIPAHAISLISDEETESWLYDVLTPIFRAAAFLCTCFFFNYFSSFIPRHH